MKDPSPIWLGLVLAGLHVIAFPALVGRCQRDPLAVTVPPAGAALVAPVGILPEDAQVPVGIDGRTTVLIDGKPAARGLAWQRLGPGLHRQEWEVTYRGGFTRRVGRTVLAGPLQDAKAPPCGAWLTITQPMVDGLAAILKQRIGEGLAGQYGFRRVEEVDLHFSDVRGGSLVAFVDLRFSLGLVSVLVWIVPHIDDGVLRIEAEAEATVKLDNSVARGAVGLFRQGERIDRLATELAQSETEKAVRPIEAMFVAPPPVPLGGGRQLKLSYCKGEKIRVVRRSHASIPFAIAPYAHATGMQPILLPSRFEPPPFSAPVSLDLDLNAVNAILHHVWASGYFDAILAERRLDRWFNEQEQVRDLLTIRLHELTLTVPPTLEPNRGPDAARRPFTLGAEAGLTISDTTLRTPARVFGRVDLALVTGKNGRLAADVALHDLALTCEPSPGRLEPCYATLVDEAAKGASELHGPIADALAAWLEKLVVGRTFGGAAGAPHFTVASARMHTRDQAWFRLELDGPISEE